MIMSRTSGAPRATEATTSAPAGSSCSRLSSRRSVERSRRCSRSASTWLRCGESHQPERGRDRRFEKRRVAHGREVDEPRPVRESIADGLGDPQREAGLAAPAGPGQGQDPGGAEEVAERFDLVCTADELGYVPWQIARRLDGPERSRVVRRALDDETMQPQRILEILDGTEALVGDRHAVPIRARGRRTVLAECLHQRLGQHDLAAVAGRGDPRRVVHVDADVVAPARLPSGRDGAGPRPGGGPFGPGGGTSRARARRRWLVGPPRQRAWRASGRSNAAKNASPSVLTTTPPFDSIAPAEKPIVARDDRRPVIRADRLLEARRTLDVREQEGDAGSGGKCHRSAGNGGSRAPPRRCRSVANQWARRGAGRCDRPLDDFS